MGMLVMALGSASGGAAHADAAKDCLYKFYNATNNLRFDLALSRSLLVEGEACLRDAKVQASAEYGAIKREAEKARGALADAERDLASRKEAQAFYGGAKDLLQRIHRDDGFGYEKLAAERTALQKRGAVLAERNRNVSVRGGTFEKIEEALKHLAIRRAKAENEKHLERIGALAVVTRSRGKFTPEDSLDQEKIRAAFLTAGPEHFVVAVQGGGARYSPAVTDFEYARQAAHEATGLVRGALISWSDDGSLYPYYRYFPKTLAGHTLGLVWSAIDKRTVLFVTMDGGRYHADAMKLWIGWIKPTLWPRTQAHEALLPEDIEKLAQVKALPTAIWQNLRSAAAGYSRCSGRIWKSFDRRFDAIRAQDIREATRKRRLDQLGDEVRSRVERRCRVFVRRYKAAFVAALDARNADRKKTADVVRARMLEVIASAMKSEPKS
jgi:hypothetical protein